MMSVSFCLPKCINVVLTLFGMLPVKHMSKAYLMRRLLWQQWWVGESSNIQMGQDWTGMLPERAAASHGCPELQRRCKCAV